MEDEFQVLATDYETFALEYKCDPNGILEKQGEEVHECVREWKGVRKREGVEGRECVREWKGVEGREGGL